MEEKILIYAAGNPDAYPLEYYDADSQAYQGIIPELFREFSAQSRYEIVYYQAGKTDRREHLAKNLHVDIVSGYTEGGAIPPGVQALTIFHTTQAGEDVAYQLCFTQIAPESLQSDFSKFVESVSQEKISGLLITSAEPPHNPAGFYWGMGALSLAVIALLSAIILLARHDRKKLNKARRDLEIDETTGLGNFDCLVRYYSQFINDKNRILYSLVYFYVDTDRLRRLSSSEETDDFLRYCAAVLQEYTADTDILAKVSDHGFVLMKLTSNLQKLDEWFTPLFYRIRSYTEKYAKPFEAGVTAGVYPLKAGDRDLNEMILSASQAAYMAAREHEDYVICSDQMLQKLTEEKQLHLDLEQAFAKSEFQLYIQFYVDAHSFQTVGGEALSRWNHPQKGVLTPNLFVPLLEREKMIGKLDYYCLRKVCEFLEDLVRNKVETFFISCNFSRETLAAADFVDRCQEIMNAYHFPRELLIFEITESVPEKNITQIKRNLIALKKYGVRIVLDDFGEGFTSLYDLQKYSVDGIKLDKGLIENVTAESGKAILKAMIQVGHELGVTILAEGVETDEQVQALQELRCDVIQGFRFCLPLPEREAKNKVLEQFL